MLEALCLLRYMYIIFFHSLGEIDEVRHEIAMHWVQPRVLDLTQVRPSARTCIYVYINHNVATVQHLPVSMLLYRNIPRINNI